MADAWVDWAIERLRPRGPDGAATWHGEGAPSIGHTRLAVVGGEDAKQPLLDPQGRFVVAGNAEVYDHHRWRAFLDAGVTPGSSDCGILIPLLHRYELDTVASLLDADFALVVVDRTLRRLHLLRDRFGVRPLSLRVTPSAVYVSSEEQVTAAGPGSRPRIDTRGLLAQVCGAVTPTRSLWEHVVVLAPGERISISWIGRRLRIDRRRWAVPIWGTAPRADHLEPLDDLVSAVVASRIPTSRPCAVYLSGGIDSGVVAAGVAKSRVGDPLAMTVRFVDQPDEDADRACAVSGTLELTHEEVPLTDGEVFAAYPSAIRIAGHVTSNPLAAARLLLSQAAASRGRRVVFTGEGADELFGRYVHFEVDMAWSRNVEASIVYRRYGLHGAPAEELQTHPAWDALIGFTPTWARTWLAATKEIATLLTPTGLALLARGDPHSAMVRTVGDLESGDSFERSCEAWMRTVFERRILGWSTERMDAACGVEGRPVFCSAELAGQASSVTPEARTIVGDPKSGFRSALRGLVPTPVRSAPKRGFVAADGTRPGGWHPVFERILEQGLHPDVIDGLGLFNAVEVAKYVDVTASSHGYEQRRRARVVHHLVSAHLLFEAVK